MNIMHNIFRTYFNVHSKAYSIYKHLRIYIVHFQRNNWPVYPIFDALHNKLYPLSNHRSIHCDSVIGGCLLKDNKALYLSYKYSHVPIELNIKITG